MAFIQGSFDDDVLLGGAEDDILSGIDGNDVLDGGGGTNFLYGGNGQDTYLLHSNGAQNTVIDGNEPDTLVFTDVDLQSLHCRAEWRDLIITWGNGNQLTLPDHFFSPTMQVQIKPDAAATAYATFSAEQFLQQLTLHTAAAGGESSLSNFAEHVLGGAGNDGIGLGGGDDVAEGGAGDDTLNGDDGNDQLEGGSGYNLLDGGAGNDVFVARTDGGHDLIQRGEAQPGELDTLVFTDVALDDIQMTAEGAMLQFRWGDGDLVEMFQFFGSGSATVDAFTIKASAGDADATTFSLEQLLAAKTLTLGDGGNAIMFTDFGERVLSGAGNDSLSLGGGDDWADGGAGDDEIGGGDGNDVLNGGAGSDSIFLGDGNDTVLVQAGSGADVVFDGGGDDTMVFEAIGRSAVTAVQEGDALLLYLGGAEINIVGQFWSDGSGAVEHFQFTDGTFTAAELLGIA